MSSNNKQIMNKTKLYNNSKKLAAELGMDVSFLKRKWRDSSTLFWKNKQTLLARNKKNRANNHRRAVTLASKNRESLSLPDRLRGTSNERWIRELRRLRAREKREKEVIKKRDKRLIQLSREIDREIDEPVFRTFEEIEQEIRQKKMKDLFDKLIREKKFNRILEIVIDSNYTLSASQAHKFYIHHLFQGRFVMLLTNKENRTKTVTLNASTKRWLKDLLMFGTEYVTVNEYESDVIVEYHFVDLKSVVIEELIRHTRVIKNKDAEFFEYINTTDIDLSKYQIFNQEQAYEEENTEKSEHCLMHSMLQCGVSVTLVNAVKLAFVEGCKIRKKDLTEVANLIGRDIVLHYMNSTEGDNDIYKKVHKSELQDYEPIHISIYENHFFIFEKTTFSKFSIKNYELVKEENNFNNIVRKRPIKNRITFTRKEDTAKINSLLMVHTLFEAKYFKKLDLVKFAESNASTTTSNIYLDNIEKEQQLVEFKNKKPVKPEDKAAIFYADCESYVEGVDYHQMQLVGFVSEQDDDVYILNVNDKSSKHETVSTTKRTVQRLFDLLTKAGKQNALVYFHNVKYDYHLFEPYINIKDKCQKDGNIYNIKMTYKSKTIEFRDSYKMIPFALGKFQKSFELPKEYGKKEAIAYGFHTPKRNNDKRVTTKKYKKMLSKKERIIFDENMKTEPTYDEKDQTFIPLEYYKKYLEMDCLVLKKGMEKFNEIIKEVTENKMNVYDSLTISSLTDRYMRMEGAYDGIYEVCGNLREYIAKAVYGGRVHVNTEYTKKIITGKISDFDACSLYPSAIERICNEKGLSKGMAKRFTSGNYNWRNKHYAIMTVKIIKVNKIQQMPMVAHKTDTSMDYLNTAPVKPVIIDSTTLEDYINFQKIEYEIIDGVYWDEGGNNKMGEVIKRLYSERLKLKKLKPAVANVIKLMLNSSYGKTIMKKSKVKKSIIKGNLNRYDKETKKWSTEKNKLFDNYVYNNFNTIRGYRKLNEDNIEIEEICSDVSYNRGHIGCAILSMSKRIMNEVFDIANTEGYNIYYTDTDSIHCDLKDIEGLNTAYLKKYNKQLIGNQMGQFHTDFDLEGAASEIYATISIPLGKKSYLDVLESKNDKGETINGYHIRLKGITKEGLEHEAKKYDDSYLGLYKELAKGKEIEMILNPFNPDENKNKVLFEFKEGKVRTRKEFTRVVRF